MKFSMIEMTMDEVDDDSKCMIENGNSDQLHAPWISYSCRLFGDTFTAPGPLVQVVDSG